LFVRGYIYTNLLSIFDYLNARPFMEQTMSDVKKERNAKRRGAKKKRDKERKRAQTTKYSFVQEFQQQEQPEEQNVETPVVND